MSARRIVSLLFALLMLGAVSGRAGTPPAPFGQGCQAPTMPPKMSGNGAVLDMTVQPPVLNGTNVSSVFNPLACSGADLGAQINNVITSNPVVVRF